MKSKISMLILAFLLLSTKCYYDKPGCHSCIELVNQSDQDVVFATLSSYKGRFMLTRQFVIQTNGKKDYDFPNNCWEHIIRTGDTSMTILYFVNPFKFNSQKKWYSYDSIEYYNEILKKVVLTETDIDSLERSGFRVFYP